MKKPYLKNTKIILFMIIPLHFIQISMANLAKYKLEILLNDMRLDSTSPIQILAFRLLQNKHTKEYILSFRGTELSNWEKDIVGADRNLIGGKLPNNQYIDMILFYYQCIGKMPFCVELDSKPSMKYSASYQLWQRIYNISTQRKPYIAKALLRDSTLPPTSLNFIPPITSATKITLTGHSLGGCLAQLFALSFADDKQSSIIKEVYTFNSPGAKDLKPPYDMLIFIHKATNDTIKESLFELHKKAIEKKAKELKINGFGLNGQTQTKFKEMISLANVNTYFGISFSTRSGKDIDYAYINYEKIPDSLSQPYQTLIHNYDNRSNKNYILNISDNVFHVESRNQAHKHHHAKETYTENAIQHLGKDIEGNYLILNLNFGGMDSHSITAITKLLYFYDYLYQTNETLIDTQSKDIKIEYELHKEDFLKEHSEINTKEHSGYKKALEYCNKIAFAINRILHNIEIEKALATSSSDIFSKTS